MHGFRVALERILERYGSPTVLVKLGDRTFGDQPNIILLRIRTENPGRRSAQGRRRRRSGHGPTLGKCSSRSSEWSARFSNRSIKRRVGTVRSVLVHPSIRSAPKAQILISPQTCNPAVEGAHQRRSCLSLSSPPSVCSFSFFFFFFSFFSSLRRRVISGERAEEHRRRCTVVEGTRERETGLRDRREKDGHETRIMYTRSSPIFSGVTLVKRCFLQPVEKGARWRFVSSIEITVSKRRNASDDWLWHACGKTFARPVYSWMVFRSGSGSFFFWINWFFWFFCTIIDSFIAR